MEFTHEIEIQRSPAEVFAYLTDASKLASWQPTTVGVHRDADGPLTLGERFVEVHKALGREHRTTVEVVAYEPPSLFALHIVEGAVPLDGRWELEPIATGTRLRFTGRGDVRGAMRFAKPMLARQFRGYHERLKTLLEEDAA
jgi:uncharacterized protein YndB with AHSA1/START domain